MWSGRSSPDGRPFKTAQPVAPWTERVVRDRLRVSFGYRQNSSCPSPAGGLLCQSRAGGFDGPCLAAPVGFHGLDRDRRGCRHGLSRVVPHLPVVVLRTRRSRDDHPFHPGLADHHVRDGHDFKCGGFRPRLQNAHRRPHRARLSVHDHAADRVRPRPSLRPACRDRRRARAGGLLAERTGLQRDGVYRQGQRRDVGDHDRVFHTARPALDALADEGAGGRNGRDRCPGDDVEHDQDRAPPGPGRPDFPSSCLPSAQVARPGHCR